MEEPSAGDTDGPSSSGSGERDGRDVPFLSNVKKKGTSFFENSPKLFRSLIDYGRKSSEERGRGGDKKFLTLKSDSFCDLETSIDQDEGEEVIDRSVLIITHCPTNILVTHSDDEEDDHSDKTDLIQKKKDPFRKNTLSSGEVTVIVNHDFEIGKHLLASGDILESDRRQKHVTVTNIFSHPSVSEGRDVTLESQLRLTDSQLLFNIEALKIAKRARDLQITTNTSGATSSGSGSASNKSRKLIKPNFILNKLRKFKSLPNLSVIKSIAMRRIKSRSELTVGDNDQCDRCGPAWGQFGQWSRLCNKHQRDLNTGRCRDAMGLVGCHLAGHDAMMLRSVRLLPGGWSPSPGSRSPGRVTFVAQKLFMSQSTPTQDEKLSALLATVSKLLHLPQEAALLLRAYELDLVSSWRVWVRCLTESLSSSSNSLSDDSDNFIDRVTQYNNQVKKWVVQAIVCLKTQADRNTQFRSFIQLAKCCLDLNNFNTSYQILSGLRSPQLSASAVVNDQVLVELGKAFFGRKYSKSLRSSVSSHGFAPIPVYSSFLIDLDEVFSNFAIIKMLDGQIQAISNYCGQNGFFSRLDPTGLCNETLTEKSGRIQRIISRIYDRVRKERVPDDSDKEDLKFLDESPHGVSLVSLLPAFDFASLKLAHVGTAVLHMDPSTHQTALVDLKLEQCNGTITWSCPKGAEFTFQKSRDISPGLKMKYTTTCKENITYLDEGFIDMVTLKTIELGCVDMLTVPQQTLADISSCFKVQHIQLTLTFGSSLATNKQAIFVCPTSVGHTWAKLLNEIKAQMAKDCVKLRWLKEQYLYLYYFDEACKGPLAADAIKVFGGRSWTPTGESKDHIKGGRKISGLYGLSVQRPKKMSVGNGNIHPLNRRGIQDLSETFSLSSPISSPSSQRRSLAVPPSFMLGPLMSSEPILEEDFGKGSLRASGSITHGSEMSFQDFADLFKIFSIRLRKDIRDIFKTHAVSLKKIEHIYVASDSSISNSFKKDDPKVIIGSITRNSSLDLVNFKARSEKKKIYDALAVGSILHNSSGLDTSKDMVIPSDAFLHFLNQYQGENLVLEDANKLIKLHEPHPDLMRRHLLSFEGFARYLLDQENSALVEDTFDEAMMDMPLSYYYIASSHNTYLTGHQLKGQSSVELYRQILLSGCRCVELDCWNGDDGFPIIYHGHTLTSKISFREVLIAIKKSAFVTSSYPVILSIENHCSLSQQRRMAALFQDILGDMLITSPFEEGETTLPSPNQLRFKIIIKNKKLPEAGGAAANNTNDDEADSDFEDEQFLNEISSDDEFDDEEDIPMPLELFNIRRQQRIQDYYQVSPPPHARHVSGVGRTRGRASTVDSPMLHRHALLAGTGRNNSIRRRKVFQIAQELSDLVVYCQSEKFKGFKDTDRLDAGPLIPSRVRQLNGSLENSPSGSLNSLHTIGRLSDSSPATIYKCSSIQESEAKHICRKYAIKMLDHTENHLVRCYPAGMRIDSSNYSPITMWLGGIQMVALNYQTSDTHISLNNAFFAQNNRCGYVPKPKVMRGPDHVLYKRFNPFKKEIEGLHSTFIELTIISGQYVCQQDFSASCIVEVEVLGIPKDCFKYKTKLCSKNSLNPIWDDTFEIEVRMPELAFLKFTVYDIGTNLPTAQRIVPISQLRSGYRNVTLNSPDNKQLPLSSIFICSIFHRDSHSLCSEIDGPNPNIIQKKRMSFLVVHDVSDNNPYAILKVSTESTTQDVIKMALEKAGKNTNANDFVLVEEFEDDGVVGPHQRPVGMEETPLSLRSRWRNDGRFVLKQVGMDPSKRAQLFSQIVAQRKPSMMPLVKVDSGETSEEEAVGGATAIIDEAPEDKFLIPIFNVSPTVTHTMLYCNKSSTASDIVKMALEKRQGDQTSPRMRVEDFVLVEEIDIDPKKRGKKLIHRIVNNDENVYLVQNSWKGFGKLTLTERDKINLKFKNLDLHPSIRETQSDPVFSPRTRRRNGLINRVRRLSRNIVGSFPEEIDEEVKQVVLGIDKKREAVSDGEVTDDDDKAEKSRKVSKAFRPVKIW